MGLFETSKTPDELFQWVRQRPGWNRIQEPLLKRIFQNAQGDIWKLKGFIMVSEMFNLVNHNFLELQVDSPSSDMTLGLFASTLHHLGTQQAEICVRSGSKNEKDQAYSLAQYAYKASILCDKRILPSYGGLAHLYRIGGHVDNAREWCDKGLRLARSIKTGEVSGSMWDMTVDTMESMLQDMKRNFLR